MNAEFDSSPTAAHSAAGSRGHESPGRILREGRTAAGMSVEELASRTRLSKATIQAMETDAFHDLLEPVYVRGYYRKCAKVLNLAETPLIRAYEGHVGPVHVTAPTKLRLASGGELGSMPRLSARFAILAPVVGVIAGVVIWQLRGPGPASTAVTEPAVMEPQGSPETSYETPGNESTTSLPDGFDAAPAEPAAPASAPAADPLANPGTAAPTPAATTATSLTLQFNAISWARVEDSSGRSLLSGVIAAGERRVLEGAPPYSIFLGNAPGVSVEFRGQVVDFKSFVKDNSTARFSVPAAGG